MKNSAQLSLFPVTRKPRSKKRLFTIGERFGRLVILGEESYRGRSRHIFCRCDCGTERPFSVGGLVRGTTTSCGCFWLEKLTSHGMTGHPSYICWENMRHRCEMPNLPNYKDYGGRGIAVCAGWQFFENFYADMGDRPSEKHSIDRKDNNAGYWCGRCDECKSFGRVSNCRWATKKQQGQNRRERRKPTHCKRGHEYTYENTKVSKVGSWSCRECERIRQRKKPT